MGRSRLPPILAATIATLPDKPPFPAEAREAFFNMLHCAIDVAYGRPERPLNTRQMPDTNKLFDELSRPDGNWEASPEGPKFVANGDPIPTYPNYTVVKYTVDDDGYVMRAGKPPTQMRFVDVPPGTTIYDHRTSDNGNRSTIVWQDCGTRLDGTLPPGVTLR